MRRRSAFTLVEMLVSVALVLFIMVILTEAFGKGLESFRTLKAIGDMEARLRMASSVLRRDLAADHFEGRRRFSDPNGHWSSTGVPLVGFFAISQTGSPVGEGTDPENIRSARQLDRLYFTVKLRSNQRSEFFAANLAPASGGSQSPLLNPQVRTNFFDQPADARFQDTPQTYSGQWAEVLYIAQPTGTTPDGTPLHTLYRGQLVIVADNSRLNWPPFPPGCPVPDSALDQHREMSCYISNKTLYFNNPTDLTQPATARTLNRRPLDRWPLTPILTDVLSFDVQVLRQRASPPLPPEEAFVFHDADIDSASRGNPVVAIQITIRVWDQKSKQTRQMTLIQDM
jgi:type II secretory pathway pseudopilin PulG